MKRLLLLWAFALISVFSYGQRFLAPCQPLYDKFKPTRRSFLEREYLMGGNTLGYRAIYPFGGGIALTYEKGILFYSKYDEFNRSSKILNDTIMDVAYPDLLHRYKMAVPDSVTILIDRLIDAAVNTSSYLYENMGEDGIMYYFNPLYHTASCWSPRGRCGDLVDVLYRCGEAIATGCLDSVLAVMPECRQLIRSFRRDYPEDIYDNYTYHIYVSIPRTKDLWKANHDYEKKYDADLRKVAHQLFTETDCMLRDPHLSVIDNGQYHYRLSVDEYGYNTLYLDSLHLAPQEIYEVAQHIGIFDSGEYKFIPDTKSFELIQPYQEEQKIRIDDEEEDDFTDEEIVNPDEKKAAFPQLKVTDKGLYRILEKSIKKFDRDSVPGTALSLTYVDKYWNITRDKGVPYGLPLGYFEWNGQKVYVLNQGMISYERGPLLPDMEYFAKTVIKGDTIFVPESKFSHSSAFRNFGEGECPAFVVDKGKVAQYVSIPLVEEVYETAVSQILQQKGLSLNECYVSASLSPIPAEYNNPNKGIQRIHTYQDEEYQSDYIAAYQSPFSKLNSIVEKASFKLSTIDNGYFVVRYTDMQGNKEYYRFQIREDYTVTMVR